VQAKFGEATQNWMNFQPTFEAKETFKTSARETMLPFEQRSEPFKLKTNSLTANEKAVEEYRKQWTSGNHNFARTYLGAPAYKKSLQE
jgi:plasmid maintenance system antidote protein VapI